MTRTTNARLAGVTFLLYIATGLTSLALFNRVLADRQRRCCSSACSVRLTYAVHILAGSLGILSGFVGIVGVGAPEAVS